VGREIRELDTLAERRDLFGSRVGLSAEQERQSSRLRKSAAELDRVRTHLAEGRLPFFSFEVHAPEVISNGGFTIVIGNPPWVRAERIPGSVRRTLGERFSWWRSDGARGFAHQPDLSLAFLQRSLELVAPGGAVGFLLPSKVATAGYGESARRGLVRDTRIEYVHRVPDSESARFGATTYPIGIVVKKEAAGKDHSVRLDFAGSQTVIQSALDRSGPWVLLPDEVQKALATLRDSGAPLATVAPPVLGVKTGADRVFIGQCLECEQGLALIQFGDERAWVESSVLRPVLRGRDVRQFRGNPVRVMLWTHSEDGSALDTLPDKAGRYLLDRSATLLSRSDYRKGPIWSVFRVAGALSGHRVIWADIARQPRVVALDEVEPSRAIPLNTCYVSSAPDREIALAITATMNSSWAQALVFATADEARGGYRRMNARIAGQIPVPPSSSLRSALSDLSLEAHQRDVDQNELDAAVADALALPTRTQRVLLSLAKDHR
jgi:hypothetical protein